MPHVTHVLDHPDVAPVQPDDAETLRVRQPRAKPRDMPVGRLLTPAQARTP
jgi:hypothetical protein